MKKSIFPLALLLLGTVCFAPTVFATEGYKPIQGGQVTLDEFLVMDKDTPVPDASFTFTIAPGNAIEATAQASEIVPGPAGISFAGGTGVTVNSDGSAKLTFSSSDTAINESDVAAEDSVAFDTSDHEDEKYVKKALKVDLSGVSFDDVGIYRYALTEADTNDRHLLRDSNPVRYLDVYVTDTNGVLGISAVFWRRNNASPGLNEANLTSAKSTGMTSRAYRRHSLAVEKTVEGNQSSKDQYFAFTVTLTGTSPAPLTDDSLFTVSGCDPSPETNMATAYTTDEMQTANNVGGSVTYADLRAGKTFYLRHGQRLVIGDISEGLGYVVTEAQETDYTTFCQVKGDDSDPVEGCTASGGELMKDTTVAFLNVKEGVVPTGVLLRVGMPVLLGLLGLLGLLAVIILRRRRRYS